MCGLHFYMLSSIVSTEYSNIPGMADMPSTRGATTEVVPTNGPLACLGTGQSVFTVILRNSQRDQYRGAFYSKRRPAYPFTKLRLN